MWTVDYCRCRGSRNTSTYFLVLGLNNGRIMAAFCRMRRWRSRSARRSWQPSKSSIGGTAPHLKHRNKLRVWTYCTSHENLNLRTSQHTLFKIITDLAGIMYRRCNHMSTFTLYGTLRHVLALTLGTIKSAEHIAPNSKANATP
jgi:hypothetical protein